MNPIHFAKLLHEELAKDGWKEIDIKLLAEISTGKDAALSDDAYALKQAIISVFEKVKS